MKKFQMGMFALVGALTIGGGAVYASEQIQTKSVRVDGIQIEVEDEELLKALEKGEVEVILDEMEPIEDKHVSVDGIQIEVEDEEVLKALENGEIEIIIE